MIDTIKMGRLKWHHLLNPNEDDFTFLREKFHFHPLDIEDCRSINQRPKIDIYDDYYFLILHFPTFDKQNLFIKTKEEKIFWGEDFIITIEKNPWIVGNLFAEYKTMEEKDEEIDIGTSDTLLYRILEKLMSESLYLLRKVGLDLELINRELFGNKQVKIIERISVTRKNIILTNTIFKPQLRMFHKFETGQVSGYADNMEDYWGNILDYYQKM
jgi:magnesium transporter